MRYIIEGVLPLGDLTTVDPGGTTGWDLDSSNMGLRRVEVGPHGIRMIFEADSLDDLVEWAAGSGDTGEWEARELTREDGYVFEPEPL